MNEPALPQNSNENKEREREMKGSVIVSNMKKNEKNMASEVGEEEEKEEDEEENLHRLHSDLSSLLHQIDELVLQAIQLKSVTKEGKTQIQSFSRVLSDMISSLKPWVPKFQIAPSNDDCDSPQETTLVSPSPLVSWRANCTVERGRQMFMLTPLPLSSKCHQPSSSTFVALSRDMTSLMDSVVVNPTPVKPANQDRRDGSMLVMMTPCFKMSPPKSCVLLEPISENCHIGDKKVHKCTPFPVGIHYTDSEASESESPADHDASRLAFNYPELLGIHHISKSGIGKKMVEASPDWLTSPPKTCVLLEPPDEKTDNVSSIQINDSLLKQKVSKVKDDDAFEGHNEVKKSCSKDHFVGKLSHIESTPMWQEPESSFLTGKRPGENTLKKELWTKFEAASTWGCQSKLPTIQKSSQKGFLDLLEEASCDE